MFNFLAISKFVIFLILMYLNNAKEGRTAGSQYIHHHEFNIQFKIVIVHGNLLCVATDLLRVTQSMSYLHTITYNGKHCHFVHIFVGNMEFCGRSGGNTFNPNILL